jgi:hypothetical protein
VLLHIAPCLKHGPQTALPRAVREPDGTLNWALRAEQAVASYDWLAFDVRVGPTQLVIIGTDLNQTDSLGRRCFLFTETESPVQRLLVLRTVYSATDPLFNDREALRSLPLALQAGNADAIRASSP